MKDYSQDILSIRKDFPFFNKKDQKTIYFDNAATTFKPTPVLEAINDYNYNYPVNIHRAVYDLSQKASEDYEKARETVQKFLGARFSSEIIFTSGTTASINHFAQSFAQAYLKEGDRIVLSEMEHHANLLPWQKIARDYKCTLEFIPINIDGSLDLSSLDDLLKTPTKLIALTAISNTLGTNNPILEIFAKAKVNNIYTFVDGAQSVPHQPHNLSEKDKDIDFLAFSGHKMLSPTGIGVLYGKKEILKNMPPFFLGGGIVHDVTLEKSIFGSSPSKFEAGTPPIAEAIGLASAIKYMEQIGWDIIQGIDHQHTILGEEVFKQFEQSIRVFGNTTQKSPIFSFQVNEVHPHDIGSFLNEFQLCVRTGHQCTQPTWKKFGVPSVTRASAYIYNTTQDWDQLVIALKALMEFFNVRKFG